MAAVLAFDAGKAVNSCLFARETWRSLIFSVSAKIPYMSHKRRRSAKCFGYTCKTVSLAGDKSSIALIGRFTVHHNASHIPKRIPNRFIITADSWVAIARITDC